MSKDNKLEPFGYLCDWGDTQDGAQRIAVYYGEPGNGVDDDWNEHPKVYKNLPILTLDQAEAYAQELRQALHDLVRDLEMRSALKEGSGHGVVDCGNGVYMKAKAALGEL